MSGDKTRLDNRIYQTAHSDDVSPAGSAARKYGGDQQIPTAIIILLADVFSLRGNCPREIGKAFATKTGDDQLSLGSFLVAGNLALALAEWIKRSPVGSLAA